jgi:hypothetical protein
MFVLQRDGCKTVVDPSDAKLLQHLRRLRLVGRSQFLVLSEMDGDWLQIAGGTLCCIVERYCARSKTLWRAHRVKCLQMYAGVHEFALSGSNRQIEPDELLRMAEAEEIALAFRNAGDVTQIFAWRAISFGDEAEAAFGFADFK